VILVLSRVPTLVWLAGAAFAVGALAATPGESVPDSVTAQTQNAPAATTPPATPSEDDTATPEPEETPSTVLRTAKTGLGTIVTDEEGNTLYMDTLDDNDPPRSTCYGACAKAWPPLTTKGTVTPIGISSRLVGAVPRKDGKIQVTLNGWPLYTYIKDKSAGDIKGQDYKSSWYALRPNGKPIR
jgi:predicted lipoprotein with Yx(FWY)xxD motif